jgi:DNA-binding NtrC family response regulator
MGQADPTTLVPRTSPAAVLIGESAAMVQVRARIAKIGPSPVPILIIGETGTGKELAAAAIATASGRRPFVPVNCATFPDTLADSELFGYERGAFTGAHRDREGLIAHATGGVLFLDELAELAAPVQAKLLRALESGEYRRVGSAKLLRSDFRLLAAVSAEPEALIESGRLRIDLVHRLGALRLRLPPLRERREDIPVLAREFLKRFAERTGSEVRHLGVRTARFLSEQHWPGNVRQLRNVIEAAAAVSEDTVELSLVAVLQVIDTATPAQQGYDLPTRLKDLAFAAERRAVLDALVRTGGNREQAARELGISVATLYRKLANHHCARSPF